MTAANVETTEATTDNTVKLPTAAQAKAALAKAAKEALANEAAAATAAKATEQQLKNRLRNEATAEVIANHRDEFNALADAKFKANGLVFARRLTEAEKAEKKIADLIALHPELADRFPTVAVQPTSEEVAVENVPEAPVEVLAYSDPSTVNYDPSAFPAEGDGSQPEYAMAYTPGHAEDPFATEM